MKHDTTVTRPAPFPQFFTRICFVILCFNFSTLYISYIFPVEIQTVLAPCVFFSHIKIQKSHIIKTHNCCESVKRELEQRRTNFWGKQVHWQMYCTSVFLLYNPMVSPQSPFQYWMCGWLDVSKAKAQPRQVYKINPSSSCVLFKGGENEGGGRKKKKKSPQKKILFLVKSFFSAGCESHF